MGMYGGGSTTTIQAPAAPNYAQSMRETLQAQIDLAPQLYQSEAQYQPLYNQLQAEQSAYLTQAALDQAKLAYPQTAQIENAYQNQLRQGELQQLNTALPQYQQAFEALTPGQGQAIASTGQLAQQAMSNALNQPKLTNYLGGVGGPTSGSAIGAVAGPQLQSNAGVLNNQQLQSNANILNPASVGRMMGRVAGPQLQSTLGNINQGVVNQYVGAMPGMGQYADYLAQSSAAELAAGKSLTPEEQRMAQQSARASYAARGTALGAQSVNTEVLNNANVASQRYQQRLQNAASAANQIQGIYTPALQQAYQRQTGAEQYNLGAQGQAFGQAASRANIGMAAQGQMNAQQQAAQQYGLAAQGQQNAQQQAAQQYGLGAQGQAYEQAMNAEQLAAQTQQSAFAQAAQRQQAELGQLQGGQQLQAGYAQLGAGALNQLQQFQAPLLQAFYKQPILANAANQQQQMGLNMGQAAGAQYFNPESQTAMGSIYGAYNSQLNLAGAQAQANAAASAGKSGMFGALGGGLLSAGGMLGGAAIL